MTEIFIQKIETTHPLFAAVFALREKVLREPLGLSLYNEDTSGDAEDDIFIALANEKVIGCVMMKSTNETEQKLRQMAVSEEWQSKGVGQKLVLAAEADAKENGCLKISLHARQHAIGFYEKLNYTTYGELFYEVGIPHFSMSKNL